MNLLVFLLLVGCVVGVVVLHRRLNRLEDEFRQEAARRQELESRVLQGSRFQPTPYAPTPPSLQRDAQASAATPAPPPSAGPTIPRYTVPPTTAPSTPPPLPSSVPVASATTPTAPGTKDVPAFDWERFMGARLFAWLGGFALFLGVAYFVKYSFDRGLISPDLRVILGMATGFALVLGGIRLRAKAYAVTSQTLSATGIVILYAALYAGHAFYDLPWLPQAVTLAAMVGVTAGAFLLALRTEAQVIAVLGLLGGFVTPVLVSKGTDPGLPFFLYIAVLDAGLLAILIRQRWDHLSLLAVAGTLVMQVAWTGRHFMPEKSALLLGVVALFQSLFTGAAVLAARRGQDRPALFRSAVLHSAATLVVTLLIQQGAVGTTHPWLVLGLVAIAELGVLSIVAAGRAGGGSPTEPTAAPLPSHRLPHLPSRRAFPLAPMDPGNVYLVSGLLAFVVLSFWQLNHARELSLSWLLAANLGFTALHTVVPLLLRQRFGTAFRLRGLQIFPALAVASLALSFLRLNSTPFALWTALLLLDALALGLAAWIGGMLGAMVTLLVSALALGIGIGLGAAHPEPNAGSFLLMISLVSGIFVLGGAWLRNPARRWRGAEADTESPLEAAAAGQLPVLASLMPFLLLAQVAGLIPLPNPVGLFAVTLGIAGLLLGLTHFLREGWLPLGALLGSAVVTHVWILRNLPGLTHPALAIAGILALLLLLAGYPFLDAERMRLLRWPWIASAAAALPAFHATYRVTKETWPNDWMGLIPLAFALVPAAGFLRILKADSVPPRSDESEASRARLSRLAWFGGCTLFLITVALPIQFERQWLTLGFALEGAALIALFRRVPHPGLRLTGLGLLCLASARLLAEPLFGVHAIRGPISLWNPWLYTYGITAASVFFALSALPRPEVRRDPIPAHGLLGTLGVLLLFALMNLEIADFFTPVGERVYLEFTQNFARDMTYTVGWSLFALGLVGVGIRGRWAAVRWAGLGLLAVATAKLFLHDLARLDQLYRVGALVGVAIMAITASVLYQRFVSKSPVEK